MNSSLQPDSSNTDHSYSDNTMQQEGHPLNTINQTTGQAASAPNLGRTGGTTTPVTTASAEATLTPEVPITSSSGGQPLTTTAALDATQATIQGL